jgi:hypothetical protein
LAEEKKTDETPYIVAWYGAEPKFYGFCYGIDAARAKAKQVRKTHPYMRIGIFKELETE